MLGRSPPPACHSAGWQYGEVPLQTTSHGSVEAGQAVPLGYTPSGHDTEAPSHVLRSQGPFDERQTVPNAYTPVGHNSETPSHVLRSHGPLDKRHTVPAIAGAVPHAPAPLHTYVVHPTALPHDVPGGAYATVHADVPLQERVLHASDAHVTADPTQAPAALHASP